MSKVPSVGYDKVIRALRRDGWVVVRQRGSHIRLQKHTENETLKLTVPAHRPWFEHVRKSYIPGRASSIMLSDEPLS